MKIYVGILLFSITLLHSGSQEEESHEEAILNELVNQHSSENDYQEIFKLYFQMYSEWLKRENISNEDKKKYTQLVQHGKNQIKRYQKRLDKARVDQVQS